MVTIPKLHNIGFFDIETSNLKATYGFVFSYAIKVADEEKLNGGQRIYSGLITPEDMKNGNFDRRLIKQCCYDLRKFNMIVTYYGKKFDIPFLRTRAILYGLDFPLYKEVLHTDCWQIVKNRLKLHSNKLEVACDFFSIPAKAHKLSPKIWFQASLGHEKALKHIMKHNIEDVISTEKIYKLVCPYYQKTRTSI